MMKKTFLILIFLMSAQIAAPAAQAKNLWEFFFPYIAKQGEDPIKTGRAPFAQDEKSAAPASQNALSDLYQPDRAKATSLDRPHRQVDEISRWLEPAVAEIFNIDPAKFDEHSKHLRTGLSDEAMAGYNAFVAQGDLLSVLKSGNMKLTGFLEGKPFLLNEGAVDGRYRWLFEIPVTLSYIPVNQKTYANTNTVPASYKTIVRLQVGRVPRGQGLDEMMIESLSLQPRQ